MALIIPGVVYMLQHLAAQRVLEQRDAREGEARLMAKAALLIPDEGSSMEQIEAVRTGMTADTVKATLDYPYALGSEAFPHGMKTGNHYWVVHDIPVKDKGYIQAVFIDKILVGFGCVEPPDSRLCKTCLDQMLVDTRSWDKGLPCMIDDVCPECGGTEPVPFGSVLSGLQRL